MFIYKEADGSTTIILDTDDKPVHIELRGGNGDVFTVTADGGLTDQDGTNMLMAYRV